ncbi:MAG: HAD family phosphatase [Limnohabitans sp.]|nr:MAG: HAD family phosphatase [Limnohabitans sp.]
MSRDVVFDLGGVVFRWEPLVLLQQLFPQRMPDEASARHWAGQIFQTFAPEADWALFDLGRIEPEALAQRIARRTGLSEQELQQLIDGIPPHLTPLQGTVDLIHELKAAGHRLYFLSNMPALYADHLQAVHPFFAQFEQGIFSAHVQQIKPLPDIFATAQARWPLREAPVFIDDVQHNIDAAHRHGWQGIRFETPQQVRAALVAGGYLGA